MNLCRTSLYRKPDKQKRRDEKDLEALCKVHLEYPRYGVRRLSVLLGWNEKKTRRIMRLAGVKAVRTKKLPRGRAVAEIAAPVNLLKEYWRFKDEAHPERGYDFNRLTDPALHIWVQDFTYIRWHGKMAYLACTMSLSTRFIVGWSFSLEHTADFICDSLENALFRFKKPEIVHNDRGSEYMSEKHFKVCEKYGIRMSASAPGEPWQNGFMESFFGTFKDENQHRFKDAATEAELYEMVAQWIYYYNFKRLHTGLKTTPAAYAKKLGLSSRERHFRFKRIDKVLHKMGA